MVDAADPIAADAPLSRVVARFAEGRGESVPVVDADGALVGVIAAADVEAQALAERSDSPNAAYVAHATAPLHVDDTLEEAVRALALSDDAGMPVLAAATGEMVGWVTHHELLRAYHSERERLSPRGDPPAGGRGSAPPALDERDLQRDPQQVHGRGGQRGDPPQLSGELIVRASSVAVPSAAATARRFSAPARGRSEDGGDSACPGVTPRIPSSTAKAASPPTAKRKRSPTLGLPLTAVSSEIEVATVSV